MSDETQTAQPSQLVPPPQPPEVKPGTKRRMTRREKVVLVVICSLIVIPLVIAGVDIAGKLTMAEVGEGIMVAGAVFLVLVGVPMLFVRRRK